jgi:lipoprotein-anchoring transpeptidase ErfK/SrfK
MVGSWSRREFGAIVVALGMMLTTSCGTADAAWHNNGPGDTSGSPEGGAVTVTPAAGSTGVPVRDPVVVRAESATLTTVTLANAGGKQVAGEFDADHHTWTSTAPLAYNNTYTVNVGATSAKGDQITQTSGFTTLKPGGVANAYLRASGSHLLENGHTYGVGQPITVFFDRAVTDKAAVERSLEVTTEPAVEGRWHWFGKQEVHWRPQQYWAPGTEVTVKANTFGVAFGKGVYGGADRTVSFRIGRSKIAIADSDTKHMLVYFDGKVVRDIPISMGKGGIVTGQNGQTVNFWTNSGPHVVIEKQPEVRMTSASFGITDPADPNFYDEIIKLPVRITYSGEFVHLADWNIPAHGVRNTSHGCINVGPANAQWFYDNFNAGDVVDVVHTPRTLDARNGLGDWNLKWDAWVAGSALS